MSTVIRVENLSKYYRLGLIGGGTLHEDLNRWWAKVRRRPDPLLRIGETDHGNRKDGQIWALRDINLEVQEGEILGIIGRNGAGKSTLLKILSRITAPTAGCIKVRGRVASLLEVGTGFHPELTGRENIYLNGAILGMTKAEINRKLDEIIAFAEIETYIDTPVKRYSSGMTVRLAFAVAAHLEPEILVVDEVLAVGDIKFQTKCFDRIGQLCSEGRTVLVVSHNMLQLGRLCTRALLLESGCVALDGKSGDVVTRYLDKVGMDLVSQGAVAIREMKLPDDPSQPHIQAVSVDIPDPEVLSPWDRFSITISVIFPSRVPLAAIGFRIYTNQGVEVLRLGTFPLSGADILRDAEGVRHCTCAIPSLPLAGGYYSIKVVVWVPAGATLIEEDQMVKLHVAPKNLYGGTIPLDQSVGLLVTDHQWTSSSNMSQITTGV